MAVYEKTSEERHRKEETEEGTSNRFGQEAEEEKRELQK